MSFSTSASSIVCGFLCYIWINCTYEFFVIHQMIFNISLCRVDAQKLEEWARGQNSTSLIEFSSREGEVEGVLKDIAERAGGKGDFSYSRFFAVGLFRLLELANAMEPTILEKVTQFALMIYWSQLTHILILLYILFLHSKINLLNYVHLF